MKTFFSLALLLSACGFALSADGEKYTLAYKFTPGEEVRTRVTQVSTVDTKIKGEISKKGGSSLDKLSQGNRRRPTMECSRPASGTPS